jgi:hypothetical protein
MDRPPKATFQASKHSHYGEDPSPPQMSMCQRVAPHQHALAPKIMTSSSKEEHFSPPGKIVWQERGGLYCPSHYQGRPSMISLIWHAGP